MIKKLNFIIIISSIVFLVGCGNKNLPINSGNSNTETGSGTEVTDKNANYSIDDFYPFKENVSYVYEGKGMEYASFTINVDYIKDNRIQIRKNNGGTETVSVIEKKDGELLTILSKNECYYRENFLSKIENQSNILIKEPIVKGTSWILPDGRKRSISNVDMEVITNAGNFKAIEVTTVESNGTTVDYYGINVGLIKTIYKTGDTEVSSSLSKIEKDSPLVQNVRFYYPDIDKDKLYYTNKNLSFKTNDITKIFFENEFKKSPNENLGKLLGPNVKINSLYLNDDGSVYMDFSENFVEEMNAGSGYENMILQSITNTIGNYYGVDRVYITIAGNPYSSGHILKEKGEYFKVNISNSVELSE